VGEVLVDVGFDERLFAILDFRAEVRVGTASEALAELVPPEFPPPRFRFLMTSVFRDKGRTTPWSLRKRPQALHRG